MTNMAIFTQQQADDVKGYPVLTGWTMDPITLADGRLAIHTFCLNGIGVVNGVDISALPSVSIADNEFITSTNILGE